MSITNLHSHCKNVVYRNMYPRGAIFYCFHGNLYCYRGNSKILLPWGVQLHRDFYSVGSGVVVSVSAMVVVTEEEWVVWNNRGMHGVRI